jgi:two-component system chemotaxis response regulator CheY
MRSPAKRMSPPPPSVLVVDDNDALRENLAECLEAEGYSVVAAEDGADALALLDRGPLPSVVLLDLMMPGMDGRALVEAIRSEPRFRDVRLVLTTGYTSMKVRAGIAADAVLTKPFGVKELLAVLSKVGVPQPPSAAL